ncbi:MAG: phosphoglycerate kinase, partial [Pseudomonadota bacterium]
MLRVPLLSDFDIHSKRVLIRQDLNVPIKEGVITSDARIEASIPTLKYALDQGSKVLVMSHLGRPTEGEFDPNASLKPVAENLTQKLGCRVPLVTDYLNNTVEMDSGQIALLENVRFNVGEKSNDETLSRQYAGLCDLYVMDAFGTAHRAQASTYGAGKFAPARCAGPLLHAELEALGKAMSRPDRPLVAVVGGSKVSTKLEVLESLGERVDDLVPGGGIANTFLAAAGFGIGKSLAEPDLVDSAKRIMDSMSLKGSKVVLPVDVRVADHFSEHATAQVKAVGDVTGSDMILDIGPETAQVYAELVQSAMTILWNGPVGVFEFDAFSHGTQCIGEAVAESKAFSVAGGGDTIAAIDKFALSSGVSYISTGGGAFLEYLEGKTLPAVEMLTTSKRDFALTRVQRVTLTRKR